MKAIITICLKELKETLRDRRTMLAMIIIPILVFPLILGLTSMISHSFDEKSKNDTFQIALITKDPGNDFAVRFLQLSDSLGPKKVFFYTNEVIPDSLIMSDSIQLAIVIPADFESAQNAMQTAEIQLFYKETNLGARQRAQTYLGVIEAQYKAERLMQLELPVEKLTPLAMTYHNLSSPKEMIGKYVGGFLPYLFIIFGFIGCLYPAIDLFTGEKERKTLETLLTAPVERWKMLIGKMLVVVFSGLLAAISAMIGLYIAIEHMNFISDVALMDTIYSILNLKFILLLFLLLIPLTIFFAGVMIPITVHANSFKEAQSILTPINFLVILPAMVGFIPGIELSYATAFIPIVNVVLASKELMAETLSPILLIITFLTMVIFAGIAVLFSYKRFGREKSIIN